MLKYSFPVAILYLENDNDDNFCPKINKVKKKETEIVVKEWVKCAYEIMRTRKNIISTNKLLLFQISIHSEDMYNWT